MPTQLFQGSLALGSLVQVRCRIQIPMTNLNPIACLSLWLLSSPLKPNIPPHRIVLLTTVLRRCIVLRM